MKSLKPLFAHLLCVSLPAVGIAACSGSDIDSQAANMKDSWASPTAHGELQFGVDNPAQFTENNRFHAWTVTLSDVAEVALSTKLFTQNLDSVMYLYKEGTSAYVAKNDDYQGNPESRIAESLQAGRYTIVVKAVKTFQTGSFALSGTCSGAGCPKQEDQCLGDGPMTMPVVTSYSVVCESALYDILMTPEATPPAGCGAKLKERAQAYYAEYWDEIWSYAELADGDEPSVTLSYKPNAGAVVGVDLGGDEDAMDFVFDAEGNLLFYFQHNQSPDWAWFCPEDIEQVVEPDEDCVMDIVSHQGYGVEDITEGQGSVSVGDDLSHLPRQVAAAIADYTDDHIEVGTVVEFSYELWNSNWAVGAEVAFSCTQRQHMSYVILGDPNWGMRLTYLTDEDGTSLVCREL